jgi:hypothetical protein
MAPRSERPELIHLEVDRRLGHEWETWDGSPLPLGGNFDAPLRLFFSWAIGWLGLAALGTAAAVYLLHPRLALLHPSLPKWLYLSVAVISALTLLWLGAIGLAAATGRRVLPERLAERGPLRRLIRLVSGLARRFGSGDRVGNAAVKLYDKLALTRRRRVGRNELLILIPRCLARDALESVLGVARQHDVAVFVATRGQLARRAIRERKPKAVVAVACERDMVTGLDDVAGHVPVLGVTLTLPSGPCKDTRLDLGRLEEFVQRYVTGS